MKNKKKLEIVQTFPFYNSLKHEDSWQAHCCPEVSRNKKKERKKLWQLLTGALNLFSHFYSITYLVWSAETYFLPKCFFQHQHIWCVQLKPLVFQNVYSNISRFCVISWNILTYKMFLPTAVSFVWSAEISCLPKCLFQQKLMVLAEPLGFQYLYSNISKCCLIRASKMY